MTTHTAHLSIPARTAAALLLAATGPAALAQTPNAFVNTVLVANNESYQPLRFVDPLLADGWGLALRPPGAGGHFWISNAASGTTTTYIGDVHDAGGTFTPLRQDSLTAVQIGVASARTVLGEPYVPAPTGQVYNYSPTDFVVSGEGITAASKFIFVTTEGTISGWTQTPGPSGTQNQTTSVIMVDNSSWYNGEQLLYTGVAVTDFANNNKLYVANMSMARIEVFDSHFQPVPVGPGKFTVPQPEHSRLLQPWNIQYMHSGPNGEGRLWVAFVELEDPWEEESTTGAVAEFDLDGNFIRRVVTTAMVDPAADGELKAPWGLAFAPASFGPFPGHLLVANFGDGTIAAFDPQTLHFAGYLDDEAGQPLVVDGVWGITFGNGVGLGDTNALYYAAGPNGEEDGTFGTVRYLPDTCPRIPASGQPVAVAAAPGGEAAFTLNAPNPTRTDVRWEVRDGEQWTVLSDGPVAGLGAVSGASTATLTVSGVVCGGSAEVRAVVSNGCGSATSIGATLRTVSADLGGSGGMPGADGHLDNNDFIVFITRFFEEAGAADVGRQGGLMGSDGAFDNNDFVAFINLFFAGC